MIVSWAHSSSFCSTGVRAYNGGTIQWYGENIANFTLLSTYYKTLQWSTCTLAFGCWITWFTSTVEKETTAWKAEQTVFVSQLKINHVIHQPTANKYIVSQYIYRFLKLWFIFIHYESFHTHYIYLSLNKEPNLEDSNSC